MRAGEPLRVGRGLVTALSLAAGLAVAALGWFGYEGNRQWERSVAALSERSASETADLLVLALGRDMRGVQTTVLESPDWEAFVSTDGFDVRNLAASAFARYPYPEAFFGWRAPGAVVFLNRSDRRPGWIVPDAGTHAFPVSTGTAPATARRLVDRIGADLARSKPYSAFQMSIDNVPYQVVARLLYRDRFRQVPTGVAGFVVNLAWARRHYFGEMAEQVMRLGPTRRGVTPAVLDDRGVPVVGVRPHGARGSTVARTFPLLFFDPLLAEVDPAPDLVRTDWTVVVDASNDAALIVAVRNADRSLVVSALAVAALGIGLLLTVRAVRTRARVAQMRSDFVATVTHELKTPIATIRVVGDTLAHGRVGDAEKLRAYAGLVVRESKRLSRLVDNILAWARVTDAGDIYSFTRLDVAALVDDTLREFHGALAEAGFEVAVEAGPDHAFVRGDYTALGLALSNLVDNAMRHSGGQRSLRIAWGRDAGAVTIDVADRGVGIPPEDLERVRRRFVRGRTARASGSGLGLAIVDRVVGDHGGTMAMQSVPGAGTTVRITLPAAEATDDEEADSRR
jgi:signal transduction histidine kinase